MELKAVVQTIDELKKQVDSLMPMKKEYEQNLWKKLRLEFNYNSNHLEGNTLTYGQTELLLISDISPVDVRFSDAEEMKAHDVALMHIVELAQEKERPLTEQFIRDLNRIILVRPYWKEAVSFDGIPTRKEIKIGEYKSTPNSVRLRNGEIHHYASVEETPSKMADLVAWYNSQLDQLHPVVLAAEFHYRFVCIHPFDDGNGRVARLVMNYILLKNYFPPIIIKSTDKDNYLMALQKADVGDKEAIVTYIAKQLIWSLELKIKAANGEDLQELSDIQKEIELLKREKINEKNIIYRTPKTAYEVVNYLRRHLFSELSKQMNSFNDFFSEVNEAILVNGIEVREHKVVGGLRSSKIYGERVELVPYKIFDCDFSDRLPRSVSNKWELMGLKSAKDKMDFNISCIINLEETTYKVVIKTIDSKFIESIDKNYNVFLEEIDIQKIVKQVSNQVLDFIKNN